MKRLYALIALIFCFGAVEAQQDIKFNHYMFNGSILNPAVAGSGNNIQTLLMYRNQWVGFGEGVPTTITASIHSPIKITTDKKQLEFGAGLNIINDDLGSYDKVTSIQLTPVYRLPMLGGKLGIGFNVGVMQRAIDGSVFDPRDAGDVLIPTSNISTFNFDLGAGLYYNSDKMFAGLSLSHINGAKLKDPNSSVEIPLTQHLFASAGYKYVLNETFAIQPSFLLKTDFAEAQVDLTALLFYRDQFWGGLAYTSEDAIVAMVGAQKLFERFKAGYSYDFTTSDIALQSSGTHEIILGYDFNIKIPPPPRSPVKSPRWL
jgi:type IX secretion system PorP/SprF family membrane protein